MAEVVSRLKAEKVAAAPLHEARLRDCGCLVRGCRREPIHLHHERRSTGGGMGMKPGPEWQIPLCWHHHAEGHQIGWRTWERRYDLDLRAIAMWLAFQSRCLGLLPPLRRVDELQPKRTAV